MRLTKTLRLCFLTLILIGLHAVSASTQGIADKVEVKDMPSISAGLSLGVGLSTLNASQLAFPVTQLDFNAFKRHSNFNEYLSIHLLFHITPEYSIESGIIYDKKSIHLSGTTDVIVGGIAFNGREVDATYTYEYFSIPLLLKKTMGENKFKASVHTGPYLSFNQSATFVIEDHTIVEKHGGGFEQRTEEHAFTINQLARKFNIGLLFKAGLEFEASAIVTPFAQAFFAHSFSRADDLKDDFPDEVNSDGRFSSYGIAVGAYFQMK